MVAARLHDHSQPVRHRADHLITGRNGFAPAVYQHHFAVAVRPRGYEFAEFVAEGEPHDSQVFVEAQIAEIQGGIEPIRNRQFTRRADVAVLFRLADQGPVAAERMRLGVTDIVEPVARRIGIAVIEFRPVMMFGHGVLGTLGRRGSRQQEQCRSGKKERFFHDGLIYRYRTEVTLCII